LDGLEGVFPIPENVTSPWVALIITSPR